MSGNKSIKDFFRPSQSQPTKTAPSITASSGPAPAPQDAPVQALTFEISSVGLPVKALSSAKSLVGSGPLDNHNFTSSLSSPPSSSRSPSPPFSLKRDASLPLPQPGWSSSAMEIKNSDDEGEDSDSSLEDLASLLASKSSETKSRPAHNQTRAPSTPVHSKRQKSLYDFHSSPLTVLPKYKFDLKSLVSHAEKDEITEASSKRVKAMLAGQEAEELSFADNSDILSPGKVAHSELLKSVVEETEDGGAHRVTRAIMRTEATVTEKRWYFFNTQYEPVRSDKRQFPVSKVPKEWRQELRDPKMRHQTFISGFAEDMVAFGKSLPDEIFLWILDEICFESSNPLRAAYVNVLGESNKQVHELITPDAIQKIFRQIGGSSNATSVTERIKPIQKLANPYSKTDWGVLLSIISLLSKTSRHLAQASRMQAVCTLLRLCIDSVILENVDLLVAAQEAMRRLCRHTPEDEWGSFCQNICMTLFKSIQPSTLRLPIVDCISSTTPRTHDLRRRLAMCFFFDDLSYSTEHSHSLADLEKFMDRLRGPAFYINSKTDWREVAALIALLDIAVDDGRSTKIDLTDKATEARFNQNVDDLCVMIRDIMKGVGSAGAAFVSRLRAKDSLELVSQRISDTVRTKPKPREGWFDRPREKQGEHFDVEKKGMASFVMKMGRIANGVDGNGTNGRAV